MATIRKGLYAIAFLAALGAAALVIGLGAMLTTYYTLMAL